MTKASIYSDEYDLKERDIMENLTLIKGFSSLSQKQRGIFLQVNKKHLEGLGEELKKGFTPIQVSPTRKGEIIVNFKNGTWLAYNEFGEWY